MKKIYNIVTIISIIYFFLMLGLDLHFVINNKNSVGSSVPTFGANIIYILLMAVPLIFLISVRLIIKCICKRRGVVLPFELHIRDNMKKVKDTKIFCIVAVIGIILIIISFVLILQNKVLYYPSYDNLAYINLTSNENNALEEISISTDTVTYHGWGYKRSSDCPTVIYFGGNAQSSENFFADLNDKSGWDNFVNCNIIMIDYPGYGLSEGKPGYKNILKMADATYKYVEENDFYGNKEIIVMGFSLGTGVATYVASSYNVNGLILVAPYNNAKGLYNNVCNIFHGPLEILIRNPFPSDQFAQNITIPVLIIASEDDEVIPYKLSYQLKDLFVNNEFITTEGLNHNELLDDESVLNKVKQYLNNY